MARRVKTGLFFSRSLAGGIQTRLETAATKPVKSCYGLGTTRGALFPYHRPEQFILETTS